MFPVGDREYAVSFTWQRIITETYSEQGCSRVNTPGGWSTFEIYPMSKGDIQDLYVCQGSMWKNTSPNKMRLYHFEVKMNIINNMPLMVLEVLTTLRTPEPKADHESNDMSILQK